MRLRLALSLLSLTLFAAGAATAQDPVTVGPTIYKVLLDNPHVRLLEARFAKGAEIGPHAHPDHVIYVLKGGKLRVTGADGKSQDFALAAGQSMPSPAESHSAKNVGKTEIVALVFELKDAGASATTLSEFERAELVAMLEKSRDRLAAVLAQVSDESWGRRPAEGRWSVAEIVEHLATTEGMLFGMVGGSLTAAEDPEWRAIAAGTSVHGLMTMLLDRSQKFTAPEPVQPKGGKSRAELLSAFFGTREVTLDFARRTQAPLKAHTAIFPGGKMNGHQFLVMIAGHTLRHTAQAVEALAQLGAAVK